jgi:hypothetical protein
LIVTKKSADSLQEMRTMHFVIMSLSMDQKFGLRSFHFRRTKQGAWLLVVTPSWRWVWLSMSGFGLGLGMVLAIPAAPLTATLLNPNASVLVAPQEVSLIQPVSVSWSKDQVWSVGAALQWMNPRIGLVESSTLELTSLNSNLTKQLSELDLGTQIEVQGSNGGLYHFRISQISRMPTATKNEWLSLPSHRLVVTAAADPWRSDWWVITAQPIQ